MAVSEKKEPDQVAPPAEAEEPKKEEKSELPVSLSQLQLSCAALLFALHAVFSCFFFSPDSIFFPLLRGGRPVPHPSTPRDLIGNITTESRTASCRAPLLWS